MNLYNIVKFSFQKLLELYIHWACTSGWNLTSTESKIISEYQCCHIETDTGIFHIYSQIRKSGVTDAIVIDAEDTDVIVLSAHGSHKIAGMLGIKRKK